jgi:hypothetical protein
MAQQPRPMSFIDPPGPFKAKEAEPGPVFAPRYGVLPFRNATTWLRCCSR